MPEREERNAPDRLDRTRTSPLGRAPDASETEGANPDEGRVKGPPGWVKVLLALLVLYSIFGFLIVPRIVSSELAGVVEGQTGVRPTIENVSFNPFDYRLELDGFQLDDASGGEPIFSFDAFVVDVSVLRLLVAQIALEEVAIVEPRISVAIDSEGTLNLMALFEGGDGAADDASAEEEIVAEDGASEPIAVDIGSLRIEGGRLEFVDRSQDPAFEVEVSPLDVEVDDLTTRRDEDFPYTLGLTIGGNTQIRWDGRLSLDPIRSSGEIELSRLDLRIPWDYLSERLRFEVRDGWVDAKTTYDMSLGEAGGGLRVSLGDARVELTSLELRDSETGQVALEWPRLAVTDVAVKATEEGLASLIIGRVALDGGALRSHLSHDREFRLIELFEPVSVVEASLEVEELVEEEAPEASTISSGTASSGAAPSIRVDEITIQDFEIELEDRAPSRPMPIHLKPLRLVVEGYSNAKDARIDVDFEARVNTRDSQAVAANRASDGAQTSDSASDILALSGPIALDPIDATIDVAIESLALGTFQPYLEEVARIDVADGRLSTALRIRYADGRNIPLHLTGRAEIDDLATVDRRLARRFLAWERLAIEGIDYTQDRIAIDEIGLVGMKAHVIVGEDGVTNVASIFAAGDGESAAEPDSGGETSGNEVDEAAGGDESGAAGPKIEIARIRLEGVGADFDDLSLDPHFTISLDDLTGSIEGLSSEQVARAKVDLAGRVDGVAPLRIAGQVNPLSGQAYTDIEIAVEGVSLPAFTPYTGRFVGYEIARGKLDLDLAYKLAARHLVADNHVLLDRLVLGDVVESEEATTLPVGLALALLRNPEGNVEVDLPIEGDLDDPSFSVLGLLGKTAINLITRVATSPFSAVAGLVGRSGEDLANVAFESGSDEVSADERSELAALSRVLASRPALRLEIKGRAEARIDAPGLRRRRIEEEVRRIVYHSLSDRERAAIGDPAAFGVSPEQRLDVLESLYRKRIGGRPTERIPSESLPPRGPDRTRVVSETALEALAEGVPLEDRDLRALARDRAAAIQGALLSSTDISSDRLFLVAEEVVGDAAPAEAPGSGGTPIELARVNAELALTAD